LGPYEIAALIGSGGMGEVYRARDTRLDRSVAVKVCDEQFSERFEREAHAISALNHPHICTLYDVGPNYLVMELVEGPTLADRLSGGPMPMAEALPVARQVAEALEAAHEKGVIHRDLKPANVKVTADDNVKVLDFGLAKVPETITRSSSDPSISPTITLAATRAGVILGTAAYMSPEQARGVAVDKRADVWAFGCLLFELLTGKRAFHGESLTDVLAAVVRADPDWNALPASTPSPIRRLLKRCLEKDRKRRLPDIGVARLEIDDALAAPETPAGAPTAKRRPLLAWTTWTVALIVASAAGALWQHWRTPDPEVWSAVMLGGPARAFSPKLSPDGQLLAFLAFVDELPQLGVMKPSGGSWTMLTRDRESGYIATVAWAPDGSRIFFDRYWGQPRGIYSVPPLGGEPRLLLEDAFGPTPLRDGSLIVVKLTDRADNQLFRYRPDADRLDPLPVFIRGRDVAPLVRAFPNGKEIVFYGANGESGRISSPRLYVMNLDSQRAHELAPGVDVDPQNSFSPLAVGPDGTAVFTLGSDEDTRTLLRVPAHDSGKPRVVLSFPAPAAPSTIDAARDGTLYVDQMPWVNVVLRSSPQDGVTEESTLPSVGNGAVSFLADGSILMGTIAGGKSQLSLLQRGSEPRAVVETSEETAPPATAVGRDRIAFIVGSRDTRRMAIATLRDGRIVKRFAGEATDVASMVAAPDGKTIYFASAGNIWAQAVDGGQPRKITEGTDATLDRAGRYLYVKRNRHGTIEIFRMPVQGGEAEKLEVPAGYHLAMPILSPTAVDDRGRVLVSVLSSHSFYYRPAILDPATKSMTVPPLTFDGDASRPGWTNDGKIVAYGARYISSLWRYRRK
jgi:eukaryotic-like serine/threonine-protein kinase